MKLVEVGSGDGEGRITFSWIILKGAVEDGGFKLR